MVSAFLLGAGAFVGYLLLGSLSPTSGPVQAQVLELGFEGLGETPGAYIERHVAGARLFVVMAPNLKVYRIPYDRTYLLPDVTWDRATYKCALFVFASLSFHCADPDIPPWWKERLRWSASGDNLSGELPPLPELAFTAQDDVIRIRLERR